MKLSAPMAAAGGAAWPLAPLRLTILALLLALLMYLSTAESIVAVWNSSNTFAHGYTILPISLWLIWMQRDTLASIPLAPFWPALAPLAACGGLWLLADLGDVQVTRQYAFVAMLPLAVLAMLGPQLARALAFPLCFLLLAVPFGDAFIDPLIGVTADFTVAALRATGIPVLREGTFFSIPSGSWSVVEACSGVRYLIASITLGCLYAHLMLRSFWRRVAFVAASIVVPVLANGARAYLIVMIGHLSGMKLAVGVDHLIYGWVFFGLVMFLLHWIASVWREAPAAAPPRRPAAAAPSAGQFYAAALALLVSTGVWPAYAAYLRAHESTPAPVEFSGYAPGWRDGVRFADWSPSYPRASAELRRFYRSGAQTVGLTLLYYRQQTRDSKVISSSNHLVEEQNPTWRVLHSGAREEAAPGGALAVRETAVVGPTGRMLIWHWYWMDGRFTGNEYVGKLLHIRSKLLHGEDDGAVVMLFAPYDEKPEQARAALRAFLADNLAGLAGTLAEKRKPAAIPPQ